MVQIPACPSGVAALHQGVVETSREKTAAGFCGFTKIEGYRYDSTVGDPQPTSHVKSVSHVIGIVTELSLRTTASPDGLIGPLIEGDEQPLSGHKSASRRC